MTLPIGLGQGHLATTVAAEDIDHAVQGGKDIVAEAIHALTLVVGRGHHDDHIHIHVAHHRTIDDVRHYSLNSVTKQFIKTLNLHLFYSSSS